PEQVIQEYRLVVAPKLKVKIHTLVKKGVGELSELRDSVFPLQAKLFRDKSFKSVSKIGFQDLDVTDDVPVKFLQFLRRNPEFLVLRAANRVLFKLTDVRIRVLHLKLGHIACKLSTFDVPVGSGLAGIFNLKNRIKNRLLRQACRE